MISRMDQLKVGMVVAVTLHGGVRMDLVITDILDDVKNGYPGVCGYNVNDRTDTRRCYLTQISRVVKNA